MPVEVRRYILARRAEGVPATPAFPSGTAKASLVLAARGRYGDVFVSCGLRSRFERAARRADDGGGGRRERLAAASCAVVTPRAEELFEMTAGDLSSAGATVRLRSSVAFRRTDFGRAMMSALDLVRGGGHGASRRSISRIPRFRA